MKSLGKMKGNKENIRFTKLKWIWRI